MDWCNCAVVLLRVVEVELSRDVKRAGEEANSPTCEYLRGKVCSAHWSDAGLGKCKERSTILEIGQKM